MTAAEIFDQLVRTRLGGQDAAQFLAPVYERDSHDPMLLPDMDKAIARLKRAQKSGELVYIYGDYDIDGLSATALLAQAFRAFGIQAKTYIPDRFTEGYGVHASAIEKFAVDSRLVVSVDCGSRSLEAVERANSLGVEVIVTDHHELGSVLPNAFAVVNPKRKGSRYPFTELAGVGVAFKLVQALQQELPGLPPGHEKWLLDLVALGTVGDVVDLVGENRMLVRFGLEVMARSRRPGLEALMVVSGVSADAITAEQLAFQLIPRLNAAGRMGQADVALRLLSTNDRLTALKAAQQLEQLNTRRRALQAQAIEQADKLARVSRDRVLVLSHDDWHQGILGIVAAKVMEGHQKPTFVFQRLGGQSKGSARSFGDFHLHEALEGLRQYLIAGGGHHHAAGLTLATENLATFRTEINRHYDSLGLKDQLPLMNLSHDIELQSVSALGLPLIRLLSQLEPFGKANPRPSFLLREVAISGQRPLGRDGRHARVQLTAADDSTAEVVCFNQASKLSALSQKAKRLKALVTLEANVYRGLESAQLRLVDISEGL